MPQLPATVRVTDRSCMVTWRAVGACRFSLSLSRASQARLQLTVT